MKTVGHISQLDGLTMKMRRIDMMVANPKSMDPHVLLLTLSMNNMSGQQVSRSAMLMAVYEVQISNPNCPTMRLGPQYMREVDMPINACANVIDLSEAYLNTSNGLEALLYLTVYCRFITCYTSYILTISFCFLFIHPISLISFSNFYAPCIAKYIGDSFIQKVMTKAHINEGMNRQQMVEIFQSQNRQQKRVTNKAPTMKNACTIDDIFCLKLSFTHSAAKHNKVPQRESDPIPQSIRPREAIQSDCANIRMIHPRTVSQHPKTSAAFLPILSANMAIKKQPIMVPRQGALEQRFKQTQSSQ